MFYEHKASYYGFKFRVKKKSKRINLIMHFIFYGI